MLTVRVAVLEQHAVAEACIQRNWNMPGFGFEGVKGWRKRADLGRVGNTSAKDEYDYMFSENGLMAFKAGELLEEASFRKHLGEDNLKVRSRRLLLWDPSSPAQTASRVGLASSKSPPKRAHAARVGLRC